MKQPLHHCGWKIRIDTLEIIGYLHFQLRRKDCLYDSLYQCYVKMRLTISTKPRISDAKNIPFAKKKQPIFFDRAFWKRSTESTIQTCYPPFPRGAPFFCDHSVTRFVNSFEDLGWASHTPAKFNITPWKLTFPIGKACLPTILFEGRAVKLWGCNFHFLRLWAPQIFPEDLEVPKFSGVPRDKPS